MDFPALFSDPDRVALARARRQLQAELLAARCPGGPWEGRLASSALATATALSALAVAGSTPLGHLATASRLEALRDRGLAWLLAHQNADGGWGDTDRSHSNIATTMLVLAACELAAAPPAADAARQRAKDYVSRAGGVPSLRRRYGVDKTFAVPILTNAALAGLVGWHEVSPLPLELACFPQPLYRFLRLPVVSYAIPALVAIGLARFVHAPPRWPWIRWMRRSAVVPALRVLRQMQPDSGGYLEATPLTSFVVMGLAGSGYAGHPVVARGLEFLLRSVRDDGSWPIDTNLATWNTSLAVQALAAAGSDVTELDCLLDWLLGCQHTRRHPYTGAAPGGWGWSDLSGAVPDADDTPGVLLALAAWRSGGHVRGCDGQRILAAARRGVDWLLDVQNADGGWPTFCRGWGRLPFDRSGDDLTAHALRSLHCWRGQWPEIDRRVARSSARGLAFLARRQQPDGSWTPLWFGHQDHPDETNPLYGTARVVLAYHEMGQGDAPPAQRAVEWLCGVQHPDGSWRAGGLGPAEAPPGARPSVEETALGLEALCGARLNAPVQAAILKAVRWLIAAVDRGEHRQAQPIGFYFARLWYYEQLYPTVFATAALGRAARHAGAASTLMADPATR